MFFIGDKKVKIILTKDDGSVSTLNKRNQNWFFTNKKTNGTKKS